MLPIFGDIRHIIFNTKAPIWRREGECTAVCLIIDIIDHCVLVINPRYGMCRPDIDFPRMLHLYEKGELLLDELVTTTYALDDLPQAFEDMHRGVNAKGVLVME